MSFLGLRMSDALALIDTATGETRSYRQLLRDTAELDPLRGCGKRLVFLLSRNDHFSVTAYASTQLRGHAVALVDGGRPLADLVSVIRDYRPDIIAGPLGSAEALQALGMAVDRVHVALGGELVSMVGAAGPALHPALAVLLGTSGTTGSGKHVRLSNANVESNARSIVEYIGITPMERPITSLPLHYSFGLSVLNSHWLAGAPVVLSMDSVVQRSFWESVERHGCTSVAGVPYTYQLLERIGFRDMELPTVNSMQQAGGAMDRTLVGIYGEYMRGRGGRFFVMYGQTEATARIAYVPPERLREKVGSAGIAIPGGRLCIDLSGEGSPGQTTSGEVVYEGPNVMLGYAEGRDDLAAGDQLGGILRTGDIGYLDDEGFLFLTGRSTRIAKVFGLRLNLDEVELMLREQGPAAVIAGDNAVWGFCAFGTDETLTELRDALSRRLRLHHSALNLRQVADIPVLGSGKTDYRQIERWVESKERPVQPG